MHRKVHKSKRLSVNEKIKAIHAVLVENEFHAVVAKQLRVKPAVISVLVNKAKKHQ